MQRYYLSSLYTSSAIIRHRCGGEILQVRKIFYCEPVSYTHLTLPTIYSV